MKLAASIGATAIVGALALPLSGKPTSVRMGDVSVGSTPTFSFNGAPVNARGVKSLADMRGKPVLVEFWGTR
ncbi:MAG: hypothetical protein GY711_28995 [bacterium]|nr:hypothetical protein [bacterium]